jgi:hypothetical protein
VCQFQDSIGHSCRTGIDAECKTVPGFSRRKPNIQRFTAAAFTVIESIAGCRAWGFYGNLRSAAPPNRSRDLFAVSLLENGVSIENVSVLLGDSSVRITQPP